MMRIFTKSLKVGVLFIFLTGYVQAQEDLDQLFQSGIEDANKLIKGYVDPFMTGFGTGLGSGWYNTAKAHKSLGFDLGFSVALAYVPDEDLFYDVNSIGLSNTTILSPTDGRAPTFFGPNETPVYEFTYEDSNGNQFTSPPFDGPPGLDLEGEIGFSAVPVAIPQLGIGIYKNTDIKLRLLPEINIGDDGTFKLFGLGVLHDIKQHIPGLKMAPFDWAVIIGFTDVETRVDFSDPADPSTAGQQGIFDVNTFTMQTIASKTFSVITFYGGLGFNSVKSELKMVGDYEVSDNSGGSTTVTDPIDLSFKSGGARFTAGFRLKLAILTLHADYTLQKYKTLNVGLGFSVR